MPPGDVSAVIGKSVQIKGELQGNEDLLIDGQVDGTITLHESRLTIGPNARVKANVSARDIVVMGMLQGELHASGRIELRAGSQVVGDLRAGRLSIEENASYSGKVDLLQSGKEEARTAAAAVQSAASHAPVSPGTSPSPATKPLF
uniref:Polymer-forming cytoskeletal protein n=1 Tax=Acidobacterium capsulatum TaxID=33075 RepID=A0A7V4XS15_9BACT